MDCAPLMADEIFNQKSIELNGVSGHIIFGIFVLFSLYKFGFLDTLLILVILFILALIIKKREIDKKRSEISKDVFYENVKAGDTIIVCRGGKSGISSDITELFLYFILGTIASGSIMGHVGQVFMDKDDVLKVTDVRHNSLYKSSNKHFICTVPEFINEQYEGVKFWKPLTRTLTERESERLTKVVHLISENTGHCHDCFNPVRILNTPHPTASLEEILQFGKKYGFGCAENIGFIQRIAGFDEVPYNRFILPHHFDTDAIKII